MKNLIQHKTNLFQEYLKYVITLLGPISVHGNPQDNMYYTPRFWFSQSRELKLRDSDNDIDLRCLLLNRCKQCSLEPHYIQFMLNNHISIYI